MKSRVSASSRTLSRIQREFSRAVKHRTHASHAYPEELKRLALAGTREGHSFTEVASAAGVSVGSLRSWIQAQDARLAVPPMPPRELQITREGAGTVSPGAGAAGSVAQIRFPSGIYLELPVSTLTPAFLGALNAVGMSA